MHSAGTVPVRLESAESRLTEFDGHGCSLWRESGKSDEMGLGLVEHKSWGLQLKSWGSQLELVEHDLRKFWWSQLKLVEHKSWGLQPKMDEHDLQKSWGLQLKLVEHNLQKSQWSASKILRHVTAVTCSETRKYFAYDPDVTQLKIYQIRLCFTIWLSWKHNRNIFHFMKRDEVKPNKIPLEILNVTLVVFD